MIRYVEGSSSPELLELTSFPGAAACRIGSLFLSYGGHEDIARFWLGYEDEKPYCAVSLYGGCATVHIKEGYDPGEVREFLTLLSPSVISSDKLIFPEGRQHTELCIMALPSQPDITSLRPARVLSGYCDIPCQKIYSLLQLCRCEDIDPPPYEEFMSVLTGFQRRGTPFCSYTEEDGSISAFAMTQAVTDTTAMIGSVCTSPKMRGKGLGTSAVLSLCAALGDRRTLVICNDNNSGGFYRRMGGERVGELLLMSNE